MFHLRVARKQNNFIFSMAIILFACATKIGISQANEHLFTGDIEKYKLGKKVFSDYCARCHGENADGRGKAMPLYVKMRAARPSNFKLKFFSIRPQQYLIKIVRDGGEKHSLSEYMPPFGNELDSQQINDVVYFIQNVSKYSSNHSHVKSTKKLAVGKD